MKIYVGRWDLLPNGIDDIEMASEAVILDELVREVEEYAMNHTREDNRMGIYTPAEFEAEFNHDMEGRFTTETYWIKFF